MKKTKSSPPIVGGCSLLVIFATLCLTIFAVLTISTEVAELHLSDASAQAISNYYQADSEAELIFAKIRSGDIPPNVTVENDLYSYYCQISPTLNLYVQLYFNNDEWTVLSWRPISSNR